MNPTDTTARTVQFVTRDEHLKFVRIVAAMRKAQRAFFNARKSAPTGSHERQLREAIDAERRCDAAVADALAGEQQLPGMGGDRG